jgi:NADP-dependent 3-hydroxy acid dehydrogenase YdfG
MIQREAMKDRVVVITGASSGIGAALAEHLSKKGAKLVLVARREKELGEVAERCGGESVALPVVADVTKRDDVKRAIATAIERFGHVDVLVSNAGRGISRLVSELTDEDIDEMMLVNLKSVLYGMQAVLPHFKERKQGHILNVSSMLGRIPFAPIRSAYSAAKHAMNSLTANLRMELAHEYPGIHVSVVLPGVVHTEFGMKAKHGGPDNRKMAGQSAEEVASIIAGVIEEPRPDVYTPPGGRERVAAYYAAEDIRKLEGAMVPAGTPPIVPR